MCFAPNLIRSGEFAGSLKNYLLWDDKGHNLPSSKKSQAIKENILKKELAAGTTQLVPCGQCLQCRIQYAMNWAARCELEIPYHENSYFLTLTYDDDNVPVHNMCTDEVYRGVKDKIGYVEGKTAERLTLQKKDMQDFFKRLRFWCKKDGRYDDESGICTYYCGEYGGKTARPHYHAIVYGFSLPDLQVYKKQKGYILYNSEWLSKIWGMGHVVIGSVTYESCQYVARYVVKKRKGPNSKEWYAERGINPEFVQMSLKPGIGFRYWNDHRDEIYSIDKLYLAAGRKQTPPRFFDLKEDQLWQAIEQAENGLAQKFEIELENKAAAAEELLTKPESEHMKEIKRARRKRANDRLFEELKRTSLTMEQYMETKGKNFQKKHEIAKIRETV